MYVLPSLSPLLRQECFIKTEAEVNEWGPIADFEMYSFTTESFEKSDDLDRRGGIGLCDRDAIFVR